MNIIRFAAVICFGLVLLIKSDSASAQLKPPAPQIKFDSFNAIYHLSRDSQNVSLLSTEETILADFPAQGDFYGITRQIPKTYQGHSVEVKVLNVVDAAGNPVRFNTDSKNNNLIITTGDPEITLYGSQTFKINYQTRGVINLGTKQDEFLLNVNGRGWGQPFNKVNATIYIPKSFQARLVSDPACFVDIQSNKSCTIKTNKSSDQTIITAKTGPLVAHQPLIVKMDFQPYTFSNTKSDAKPLIFAIAVLFLGIVSSYLYIKRRNNP